MFESVLSEWLEQLLDVVLSPALWLGVALALITGFLFFIWRGGNARQLVRDMVASLVGFALGHAAGTLLGLSWLRVGSLQPLPGLVGALIALVLSRSLWRSDVRRATGR